MLKKVISGGQVGADEAGLNAARHFVLERGGWMPNGWITHEGAKPGFGQLHNMKEHEGGYKDRTWENVKEADATIRLAVNYKSPGEICTKNAIVFYKKPSFDVKFDNWSGWPITKHHEVVRWIEDNNIETLNVAGNSRKTYIYIYDMAFNFLFHVFTELGTERVKEITHDKNQ